MNILKEKEIDSFLCKQTLNCDEMEQLQAIIDISSDYVFPDRIDNAINNRFNIEIIKILINKSRSKYPQKWMQMAQESNNNELVKELVKIFNL